MTKVHATKNLSYIRFLKMIDTFDNIKSADQLDSIEESLLDHIALTMFKDQEMLVMDLIGLESLGSKATLHKRIKKLVIKGYIQLIIDTQDERKKNVVLTPKAYRYYERLSQLIDKVAKVR